jgi:hypothetical protein
MSPLMRKDKIKIKKSLEATKKSSLMTPYQLQLHKIAANEGSLAADEGLITATLWSLLMTFLFLFLILIFSLLISEKEKKNH